jgi:Acetyltransferase (GNAT) family
MNNLDQLVADHPDMFTGIYRAGEPRREKSAVTFQIENVDAVKKDGLPLLDAHYEEIAQFKDVQKLDPDWDVYYRIEGQGKLWVMTARLDGAMIGYIVMMLTNDMHYRKLMRATEDIHFILPEHRKGILGYRMLAKTKQAMREKGAHTITFRTKPSSDHGLLFERLGGVLHDLVYTIVL